MHFIHLNINSILPKIDEIRYIAKLKIATVIGLSETKLDNAFLNSELEIVHCSKLRCLTDPVEEKV